ncbi:pyridoxamine 5'-phosphate oxidase family protein [Amycolatopsis aidingensis]|uniref:pyridoxamine 5'-phosphate oxidase family protein n=1 Tax=Amycolatopsis aidingensis TaxID=2842453 RepID=UPI001E5DF30C|nr:pyridoxamine 5'-phosphate oxidase family protein [Amycolatopsis aidingensis]
MTGQQLKPQRRSRRVAMSAEEIDAYLAAERTCRVATVNDRGPHVTALWFVWHERALWLYSITDSQRWVDLRRDPRIAILVDSGHEYFELRGVEITGVAEQVGEAPRTGQDYPELVEPEKLFARKYFGIEETPYDERHGWLRVTPEKINSWDFRKMLADQ